MSLPPPSEDALAHSRRLRDTLWERIAAAGGWISFAEFMGTALYAPGLGYYAAGARKFGAAGDFVTAPEMTPLFGRALAAQAAQVMAASAPAILEVGAGSGRLAADILLTLAELDALPERYAILDLSADLRERQRQTLAATCPALLPRVEWLDRLPERFSGFVLGNELLDAMPVHLLVWQGGEARERGVVREGEGFAWESRPLPGILADAARALESDFAPGDGYLAEVGLAAQAWAAVWGGILECGTVLLLDYGFPRREFYHPQRGGGTLMCHYRHHAHGDPLWLPGLQDITAHVEFTAVAAAAHGAGLELQGYTSQGQFLLNCGILDQLACLPTDSADYIRGAGAVNKLILPHEMGELFKVIAFGRGDDPGLLGFRRGDQSHRL